MVFDEVTTGPISEGGGGSKRRVDKNFRRYASRGVSVAFLARDPRGGHNNSKVLRSPRVSGATEVTAVRRGRN